jgi:hypothetical protein
MFSAIAGKETGFVLSGEFNRSDLSRPWLAVLAVFALLAFWPSAASAAPSHSAASVFNVKSYGATGNGTTNDNPAVNEAITAANKAGGGIVEFPSGSLHYVTGVCFTGSSFAFSKNDARPTVIVNSAGPVTFNHVTAQSGSGSPSDLGFQSTNGYCVQNSTTSTGGTLKINSSSGSSPSC